MFWFWLGLLVVVIAGWWWLRQRRLQRDAELQRSIDHLGSHTETKRPPAKQPWNRPGFGPAPRMDALELGTGPMPPAAGGGEDPNKAGPMPVHDDDDGTPMPLSIADMPPDTVKPPPPPPPGAPPPPGSEEPGAEPADEPADEPVVQPVAADQPDRKVDTIDLAEIVGIDEDEELIAATLRGPQVVELPPELEAQALDLMKRHQEVAAVRLLCDTLGIGILDAQRTIRALVGR
jgi:hypothetical protein